MILLNKLLILPDLDFLTGFFDQRFDGGGIGPALIKGNFFRKTVLSDRFLKEARRGFLVPMRGEPEVNGLTLSVESPIQLLPPAKRCPRGVSCR